MKKSIILLAIMQVAFFTSISQDFNYNEGQVKTTMEIYNYVTKGYAIQISSGLDMKKGYFLWDKLSRNTKSSDGNRNVEVKALVEESSSKVCAWMLIYKKEGYSPIYFCIPTQASDNDVWNKAFYDLRDCQFGSDAYLAYCWTLYNLVGQLTNNYVNICFPGNTLISMADGTQKEISQIRKGDVVLSYNGSNNKPIKSVVEEIIEHSDHPYKITRVTLMDESILYASIEAVDNSSTKIIEGTGNHPVFSSNGIKQIDKLNTEDKLIYFDSKSNVYKDYSVLKVEKNDENVNKVYNIRLKTGFNYFADNFVVIMK